MEKLGTVYEVSGKTAKIRIHRDSACGENCAACGICKNSREMLISVTYYEKLSVGDEVLLTLDDKSFLKQSAVGYLSLTAFLIIGGVIGNLIGGDIAAFFGAILSLLAGILIFRKVFKNDTNINIRKIKR